MISAIESATGHHKSLITLKLTSPTNIEVTYEILSDESKATLMSTIDHEDFGTLLHKEITNQNIHEVITEVTVAKSEYSDIPGKRFIDVKFVIYIYI